MNVAVNGGQRGGSVDLAVAAGPEGLAEAEFLHLAGRRTRDGVDEVDRGGRLVAGDALLAVPDDGRLVDLAAGSPYDDRLDGLAPLLVRHTDHGALGDALERVDAVLDLDGRDVLAAGDDHVLLAVVDREVALVVDRAAVAGVEPAARE